jgi:tetratricopeptide (TPR) repeat protein
MPGKKEWLIRKSKKHYLGPFDTDQVKKIIRESEAGGYDEIARSTESFRYFKDSPLFAPLIEEVSPHAADEKTVNLSLEQTITAVSSRERKRRQKEIPKKPVIDLQRMKPEKIQIKKRSFWKIGRFIPVFLLICIASSLLLWALFQKEKAPLPSPAVSPDTKLQELTRTLEQFNLHFYQGRLEESAEEYDKAIELYKKALEYKPDDIRAKIHLIALDFQKNGDIQKSRRSFLKLLTEPHEKTHFIEIQNYLGLLSLKQNRIEDAIAYFLRAVREDGQFAPAHFNLGYSYFLQKQFYNARLYFDKAAKTQANLAMLYIYLGRTLERLGKDDVAIREYLNANRINPNLYIPYIHLAMIHLRLKQQKIAFGYLEKMIEKDPDYQSELSRDLRFIDETFNYRSALDAILREKEITAEAAAALAALFYLTRDMKSSKEWISRALRLNPEASPAYTIQGYLFKQEGDYGQASLSFQTALRYNFQNSLSHTQLADLAIRLGRYQEAIERCRSVLAFDPFSVIAYHRLGVALTHLDRISDAVDSFNKALEYDPNYLPAKKMLLQYSK